MVNRELYIEQKYNGKIVKSWHFTNSTRRILMGSSNQADIIMLGSKVAGMHASLECRPDDNWYVCDLGSDSGTWVDGESVVEYLIDRPVEIRMGDYELNLKVSTREPKVFKQNYTSAAGSAYNRHQIVIEKNGDILASHYVGVSEPFVFKFDKNTENLAAPKDATWVQSTYGSYTVKQRLTFIPNPLPRPRMHLKDLFNSENKYSVGGTLFLFMLLLMGALLTLSLKSTVDEKLTDNNQYQRMVYDGKMMEKLKEQAGNIRKQRMQALEAAPSKTKAVATTETKTAGRVIKNIRAAGLSELIGRISKRASQSSGIAASLARLAAIGGDSSVKGDRATVGEVGGGSVDGQKGAAGFNIGGVGTKGIGGGRGIAGFAGAGNLAKGNVGNASVGVIEDETSVEGGLDREVIAEYIRSQLGQIRYCYERQLSATPDIHGKVMVKFTIGGDGGIVTQNIGLSTLGSAMVEGCILRRVAQWKFPQPKGGMSVVVSYPFLFKSTN